MIETTKAVSEYGILMVIAGIFLYFYITDKRAWTKSQEKQFERSNEINDKLTKIIAENTAKINIHESTLDKHTDESRQSFDELGSKIDRIDGKIDMLQARTKETATREMAEEIKKEVRSLKEQ
ncbi:hypothetical protein K8P03_05200 [Anaerococcus murdochii]|uniref:Uncharacterized protein n=1 Tax=Anaerococcus murdochii TaxID=411577 RepID=A0ABS7SYV2_9FIRM|nr:hypothetical protein [Anaerococcus murdochii]MBZ2386695.1 hypothetical protein [Anaerococcus murdochii]